MQTKIVNFLSAKGGVGKSVIAANFAEILSEQGYRTAIIEAPNLNNQEIILNALQRKRISLPSAVAVKISQNLTLVSPALASQNPASSQNSIKNASSSADDCVMQNSTTKVAARTITRKNSRALMAKTTQKIPPLQIQWQTLQKILRIVQPKSRKIAKIDGILQNQKV